MAATSKTRYICTFLYGAAKYGRTVTFFADSDAHAQSLADIFRDNLVPGAGCMLTKVIQENLGSDGKIAQNLPTSGFVEDASVYVTVTCSGEASNRAGKWVLPFQNPSTANRDTIGDAIVTLSNGTNLAYWDKTTNKVLVVDGYLKSGIGQTKDRFKSVSPDYPPDTGDTPAAQQEVVPV